MGYVNVCRSVCVSSRITVYNIVFHANDSTGFAIEGDVYGIAAARDYAAMFKIAVLPVGSPVVVLTTQRERCSSEVTIVTAGIFGEQDKPNTSLLDFGSGVKQVRLRAFAENHVYLLHIR